MIGEATNAIGKVPTTLLFPLILAVLYLVVFLWSSLVSAYIQTSAVPTFAVGTTEVGKEYTESGITVKNGDPCDIDEWNKELGSHFVTVTNSRILKNCLFSW